MHTGDPDFSLRSVPISVRDADIRPDMLVDGSFNDPGYVVNVSFRSQDRTLPFLKNDPHMVVLSVFENPVIYDDVSRFRNKAFRALMVSDPRIARGKLLPAEACRKMTGFAFNWSVRDMESRFPAAIIDKRRAP